VGRPLSRRPTAAFIPVRGGSKGIPGKNLVPVGGRPLVDWVVLAALAATRLDVVVVSTDDDTIAEHVATTHPAARVVRRSAATASDTATTESAMVEFLDTETAFDQIVLLQATSPLTTGTEIDQAVELLDQGFESVVSVVRQHRFQWERGADGTGTPIAFDPARRPRRQDHDGFLVENGAIYATHSDALLASNCRVNGRVALLEMPLETYLELDEPVDALLIDTLLRDREAPRVPAPTLVSTGREIELVITDVDGCLTDNGMYYGEDGGELKRFSARDGKGFELLRNAGVRTMLLTSERGAMIGRRAAKLRVDRVVEASCDKLADADTVRRELGLAWDRVAFLGDDVHDVGLLEVVGLSACPMDATPAAISASRYRCRAPGGSGAFRELADLVLAAKR
jgi:YrbI family 3-deoxy-D-manno-octulosonate 8-phosphate phosphatase